MESVLRWRIHQTVHGKCRRLLAEVVHFLVGDSSDSCASEELIAQLMADYGTTIKRICLMYLKDPGLAEEAAQDTFVKAYFRIHTLHKEQAQKAWLITTAVNTCKDYLRKGWMKRRNRDVSLEQLYIDPSSSDEDRELVEAISALDQAYKTVILMRYYQGLRISEIAEQLHCGQATVYRRLKKAEQLLRDDLEE